MANCENDLRTTTRQDAHTNAPKTRKKRNADSSELVCNWFLGDRHRIVHFVGYRRI